MNATLLRQIADAIERDPALFDQSTWLEGADEDCGTVSCIGGWAVRLGRPDQFKEAVGANPEDPDAGLWTKYRLDTGDLAKELLELGKADADTLFNYNYYTDDGSLVVDWPAPYGGRYDQAVQSGDYGGAAAVAVTFLRALASGEATLTETGEQT